MGTLLMQRFTVQWAHVAITNFYKKRTMYVHTQCRYTAVTAIEQFKYFYSFIIAELSRIFLFTPLTLTGINLQHTKPHVIWIFI